MTLFLTTLATQEDSLFGAEGSNAGYTRVMTALATAFDWEFLTKTKPARKHWSEFGIAYKMLRPYLIHTEWPPVAEWPAVDRAWPEDVKDLQAQYFLLMSRVRAARSRRGGQRAWHRVEGCFVRAIRAYPSVERLVRQLFRVRVGEGIALTLRVAALISDCLGRSPLSLRLEHFPRHQPCVPFFVSLQSMSICGFRWGARRSLRSAARSAVAVTGRQPLPGGVVQLNLPDVRGRLVHIDEVVEKLDWGAVSAAIDLDPYFARDGPYIHKRANPSNAWHAVKIHNFARQMGTAEASGAASTATSSSTATSGHRHERLYRHERLWGPRSPGPRCSGPPGSLAQGPPVPGAPAPGAVPHP